MSEQPDRPDVVFLADRELHFVGQSVAVVWNLTDHEEVEKVSPTETVRRVRKVRLGAPYIDFVWLRWSSYEAEWYADEDSPVNGGIVSADEAERIAHELLLAANALRDAKRRLT